jgi:competence protein ComEC
MILALPVRASSAIMHRAPLFPAAAGMVAGIVLDRMFEPALWVYVCLFFVSGGMATLRRVRIPAGALIVFIMAVCVGGVLHLNAARIADPSSIERYAGTSKRIIRVRGVVASEPRVLDASPNPFQRWTYGHERTAFLLDAKSVPGMPGPTKSAGADIPVTGRIRVTVGEVVLDLRENERVEVFGWLYPLQPPRNPGSFDWSAFQRRQGVAASMLCKHRENVRRLGPAHAQRRDLVTRFRTTVRGMLTDDLATGAEMEASLLEAMVLGHRSRLDRRLNDIFIRAGCIHFLAVSGLHLAVPMSFVWWLGRRVRLPNRRCAWLMLATLLVYVLIAEPRPPILRAAVMGTLFCLSLVLRRPSAGLNWLSAAAVMLVVASPRIVFAVGFQLSFAAVCGIIYLPRALPIGAAAARRWFVRVVLRRRFAARDRELVNVPFRRDRRRPYLSQGIRRNVRRWVFLPLTVAAGAWLACLPIVAEHFHRVQLWAPLNTVAVFPLVYVIIILGFTKILVEAVSPGWGSLLTGPITLLDSWLIRFADGLGSLPGASCTVPTPPWWWIVSGYVFLLLLAWRFHPTVPVGDNPRARRESVTPSRPRWLGAACGITLVAFVLSSVAWYWPKTPERLLVTVLSVGAGTATVIELPDGRTILYDAGTSSPVDVGRNTVVPYLRHRGIARVDRVYLSHANLDHFSGLPSILEEIDTGPVILNEYFETGSTPKSPSRHLLDMLAEREHPIETLDPTTSDWDLGGVTFELLAPRGDFDESLSTNDSSTVLRLSYAGRSILLTGDIQERTQRALLQRGGLHSDVLVLPHHGGVRSSTRAFLDAVDAGILVRSSSQPMDETFNGLQAVVGATTLYNTADVGAVQVIIDEDGVRILTMR